MLSYPAKQSFGGDLKHFITLSYVAFRTLKHIGLLVSEFIWNSMTPSFVVFSPTSLPAMLLKSSFSVDGSAWNVFMFELKIQCMTFEISLLFFEDKVFLQNWNFFTLNFLISFLLSLQFFQQGVYVPQAANDLTWSLSCCKLLILTSFIHVDGDLENFVLTSGASLSITIKINLFRVSKSNQNVVSSSGISDAFQICLPVILWQCRVCLGRFLLGRVKSRILFLVIFDDIWSMNFLLLQAVLFAQ